MQIDYEILSWHNAVKNSWLSGFKGNTINVFTLFNEFVFKGAYWRYSKFRKKDAIGRRVLRFSTYPFGRRVLRFSQ